MPTVADVVQFLDEFASLRTAASWDNVGLILGEHSSPVTRVLTCLTLTENVVAEAIREGVQMIVTHHPILFRAVQKITDSTPEGRMILALARAKIAVHSPHTAFDNCKGGINDILASRLGLVDVSALRPTPTQTMCKLITFVPDTDLDRVSSAMFAAGAGKIGQYRECSFRTAGFGTFFGSDESNPTVGQAGRREEVQEWRLEVVVPESATERVVAALRASHSYEEPAFDLIPLQSPADRWGQGRIGRLPSPLDLGSLVRRVREVTRCGPIQVVGATEAPVQRVAIACGAAGEFLKDAARAGADVFLTGEMRFHDYLSAQSLGVHLILPGHYGTERLGIEMLAERIGKHWPDLIVKPSNDEQDPVTWI